MSKALSKVFYRLVVLVGVLCGLLLGNKRAIAQKYTFTHYDIQDGLIQSQVNALYQDKAHRLWIGTLGGTSRFDGKDFFSFCKLNGLSNNSVHAVFADAQGRIWFGTNKGLTRLTDQKAYNYPIIGGLKKSFVNHIVQDAGGTIWVAMGNRLFKAVGDKLQYVPVADMPDSLITTIAVNKAGTLYVTVYNKGIYYLNKAGWKSFLPFNNGINISAINVMVFDEADQHKYSILSDKGIFTFKDAVPTHQFDEQLKQVKGPYLSMAFDADNSLWIGTTNGAYYLFKGKVIHFTEANGLTDNAVSNIYKDADHNLWLATQGSGIFKYEGDNFVIYERAADTGVTPIVMGITKDKDQHILLGTDGNGLMKFDGNTITNVWLPAKPFARKIQCVFTDRHGTVWIGTFRGGIWQYNGKQFKLMPGTENTSIITIKEDEAGTIWLATSQGLYYFQDNTVYHVSNSYAFITSLLIAGKDSVLLGTQDGVMLAVNKKIVPGFKLPALNTSGILSMLKFKNSIFFGTDDRGLYIWNNGSGKVVNYSVKDGLKSNSIYSIVFDQQGIIWLGTGRGSNRMRFDAATLGATVLNSADSRDKAIESNQNAILSDGNKVLIGTTKGLTVYNSNLPETSVAKPYAIINSVTLFSNERHGAARNIDVNRDIKLSADQNHLAISFLGVYLKNPESVLYQYKLTGLDDKFGLPMKNNVVNYPSLPPGQYVFEVKAINAGGISSQNTARFSFEIAPPFYQTLTFKISAVVFFILLGIVLQNSWHYRNIQRQQAIEAMKREEKIKIRQQTAEDFHDDLGNKLTRITILSDILNAKLDKDKIEQRNLVDQIKQNAGALYNGTRDILWALDPKSDNLYETCIHIKEIGIELFMDMPIEFVFDAIDDNLKLIKLPMEYSRNINMIFKELLTNALKHAEATQVKITIEQAGADKIKMLLKDDGAGFDVQNTNKGHGINNIKARTKRIGGELNIFSEKGKGTAVELKFGRINKQ